MRVFLSGIEWVTQPPEGNRLRWWYPFDGVDSGNYLGLPEAFLVERAPIDEDIRTPEHGAGLVYPSTGNIPFNWWDNHGSVNLFDLTMVLRHDLNPVAQAIHFTYRGMSTRLMLRDRDRDQTLLDTVVADGDPVFFEAGQIGEIVVFAPSATLENLSTLDLFKDKGLKWDEIAIVGSRPTMTAPFPDVLPRHEGTGTISDTEWAELTEMAVQASASTPGSGVEGEPTRWEAFNMTLALRWELAALFGLGFYDGPQSDISPLDEVDMGAILEAPGSTTYGYRVKDRDGVLEPSNVVVCAPWPATPLTAPGAPGYVDPQVRLKADGTFEATVEQVWQHNDPRAIGVVIEEEVSSSAALGTGSTSETFEHRSRNETDPPGEGRLARSFDVPFHDVVLQAQARSTDAWDRESPPSPSSPTTPLTLVHHPLPPGLLPGAYKAGSVSIPLQTMETGDWAPDPIVESAAGRVVLFRQTAQPRVETGTGQLPIPVAGDRHKVAVAGVPDLADFDGGYLNAHGAKYGITSVSGNAVYFDAPTGANATSLFPAGPIQLQQDVTHPALWTEVADFPAVGITQTLVFSESASPPTQEADVLSYVARVRYLGRLGPASNVSQVVRIPVTPPMPPPFSVDLLGVDFYDRTMVKITLTNPVASGRFTTWWADGAYSANQFADKAQPGEYGEQSPHDHRYLFDVLTLPIPQNQARAVTIGLQAVNTGGGQSGFKVITMTIPAPP